MTFTKAKWSYDSEGFWLSLNVDDATEAKKFTAGMKEKVYTAELKESRKKRSLDANAYAWVLMEKIAQATHSTKDEVYLQMLDRYGVFTHLIVKPKVVDRVKQEWRTVRELGEVMVNGTTGVQLQCFFGSSTYDSKEMARLIDGIVSECEELGIDAATPEEIAQMKARWDNAPKDKGTRHIKESA